MTAVEDAPAQVPAGGEVSRSLFAVVLAGQKRVVLAVTAIAVLGSLAFTLQEAKTYAATAAVVVPTPLGQAAAAEPNMATEAQIARSLAVASAARQRLGSTLPPERVLARLSVRVPVDSTVLKFTYSSAQPRIAQEGARAFALQLPRCPATSVRSPEPRLGGVDLRADRRVDQASVHAPAPPGLRERCDRRDSEAQRDTAAQQIGQLKQKLAGVNGSASVASPGAVLGSVPLPTHPVSPRIVLDAILALGRRRPRVRNRGRPGVHGSRRQASPQRRGSAW